MVLPRYISVASKNPIIVFRLNNCYCFAQIVAQIVEDFGRITISRSSIQQLKLSLLSSRRVYLIGKLNLNLGVFDYSRFERVWLLPRFLNIKLLNSRQPHIILDVALGQNPCGVSKRLFDFVWGHRLHFLLLFFAFSRVFSLTLCFLLMGLLALIEIDVALVSLFIFILLSSTFILFVHIARLVYVNPLFYHADVLTVELLLHLTGFSLDPLFYYLVCRFMFAFLYSICFTLNAFFYLTSGFLFTLIFLFAFTPFRIEVFYCLKLF